MGYDEYLAARVGALLAGRTDVREQKMSGGLTDELIVRLDPDREDETLAKPHARPMDFNGCPMRGFITVRPAGLEGDRLHRWVRAAVARAESLPPK